ncbi:TolB family protein [Pendulispora albinea]|uniref:Uncharacterized protein n=1 Tax=Pendulispora albinea TaxID=2741071 RepID=A0ABZ2LY19_9BACT
MASCAGILGIDDLPERRPSVEGGPPQADPEAGGGACDPRKPFGAPQPIPGIGSAGINGWPWISEDETIIYFSRVGSATDFDIYRATRTSRSERFDHVERVSALATSVDDVDPNLTGDASTIYFVRRIEQTSYDLYMATRDGGGDFSEPVPIPGLNTARYDGLPFFSAASNELWFGSNRGDTGFALYVAKLNGTSFGAPARVAEIDTAGHENAPVLSLDAKTLYFASGPRGDPAEQGHYDIWTARREDVSKPFEAPTILPTVSSPERDMPAAISRDGCRLYLTRYMEEVPAHYNIYVAERPR